MFNCQKQKINYQLFLKKIFSFSFLLFIALFLVNNANAQTSIVDPSNPNYENGNYELNDFIRLAIQVAQIIWAVSGSLALLAFVYGGFMWLISAGNQQRVQKGKEIITGAVIGLIIVFGSYAIIYFIMNNVLGATNNPFNTSWFK